MHSEAPNPPTPHPSAHTAATPGKIMLSGEHAVVYGMPAIVMAVNRHVRATVTRRGDHLLLLEAPRLRISGQLPLDELPSLCRELDKRHARFLAGACRVSDILDDAAQFIFYAVGLCFRNIALEPAGWTITLESEIPLGCGMGSSAAVVLAVQQALAEAHGVTLSVDQRYDWALHVERLQHGRPSGADPYVCAHGGIVRFQHGRAEPLSINPGPLTAFFTGRPESTTGEAVEQVRRFADDKPLWREFAAVTVAVEEALRHHDHAKLIDAIRENHRLLTHIGVVPEPVRNFIREVEARDGAAKICGAGAVRGSRAGILWAVGHDLPASEYKPYNLAPLDS